MRPDPRASGPDPGASGTDGGSHGGAKELPARASQHSTAGPYSPVLLVRPRALIVTSGQAAIDADGRVVGASVEEQATVTLENCRRRLAEAGCTLDDVFKVNVYLADLADWSRFNDVYERAFREPRPARTTVGAKLLPGLLVEIEMWAART